MGAGLIELFPPDMLGPGVRQPVQEAEREGFRFLRRLQNEWCSGANRFQGAGEALLSATVDGRVAAVGGLNVDPYAGCSETGRLRHIYVAIPSRRLGVGTGLVSHLVKHASATFRTVRLRTDTVEGAAFYERLGFQPSCDDHATHCMTLR